VTLCRFVICCLLLGLLVSCTSQGRTKDHSSVVAQAFVGPTTLNIRDDLNPKSNTVATLKHGDKLDVIEYKRRFVRVRTEQGVVGWTDNHLLLTTEQMQELHQLAEDAKKLPSEGIASVYQDLNMHAEPNRTSPGFEQLKEGTKVEVLQHKLVSRVAQAPPPVLAPLPKLRPPRRRGKDSDKDKIPPPPKPPAPLPPRNWIEMSKAQEGNGDKKVERVKPASPAKPIPPEDWYLVRTKDGKAGWVLAHMLNMGIPDEVAQYAEGHRITSYFSLGKVDDDGTIKDNWLWTTINKGAQPYEFDSFRVFSWNRRRHRYETAFVQRNVVGYFPIEVKNASENPTFKLVIEAKEGGLVRKTYVFNGTRVSLLTTEAYRPPSS
jgi:SH3-like domain-containing protein